VTSEQPAEEAVKNYEIYFHGRAYSHILQSELLGANIQDVGGQSALAPMNGRKLFQVQKL
jgi:hypothetical protein